MGSFDRATAVRRTGEGRYTASLDAAYGFEQALNGGYLMAVLVRAALDASDRPHPISTAANFLRVARPGPAEVIVEPRKSGRTAEVARVTLTQEGVPVVDALITSGALDADARPGFSAGAGAIPALDDCLTFGEEAEGFASQVELRYDPATMGWLDGEPSGRPEMRAYFRLRDQLQREPSRPDGPSGPEGASGPDGASEPSGTYAPGGTYAPDGASAPDGAPESDGASKPGGPYEPGGASQSGGASTSGSASEPGGPYAPGGASESGGASVYGGVGGSGGASGLVGAYVPDGALLALAVDSLPPVALNTGARGWSPTVELTWHMRAVPAPGWLTLHGHGRLVSDGWFDEDVEVWDSAGRLVAQCRQIARTGRTRG